MRDENPGKASSSRDPVSDSALLSQLPSEVEAILDVEFGRGGEQPLKMHLLRPRKPPAGPLPVLVYVAGRHPGNLLHLSHFAQRGYFCATIDFRMGQNVVFPSPLEDCKCAIRFLRARADDYHLNPNRIGIWGPSAGGHLAALVGTTGGLKEFEGKGGWPEFSSRVNAVVDWFGLSGYLRNVPAADPVKYVTPDDPPFLIMHGDKDPLVPIKVSESLHEALRQKGVEVTFKVVQDAGHGGPAFSTRECNDLVVAFLDRHLKG